MRPVLSMAGSEIPDCNKKVGFLPTFGSTLTYLLNHFMRWGATKAGRLGEPGKSDADFGAGGPRTVLLRLTLPRRRSHLGGSAELCEQSGVVRREVARAGG